MTGASVDLGPGPEFDIIRDLARRWGDRARGIGDDAAVLDVPAGSRLVVTTDSSVEHVHFRREWLSPAEIGWRATTSAISDIAAMAAEPLGVLLALSLPSRWLGDLAALADGIGEAVAAAGTVVVGGDTTRADALVLGVTVLGHAPAPLGRGGAREGDRVYVTGALGGPECALRAWLRGETPAPAHRERFARPRARLREARWLAAHGARAAVDVSDGLLADLGHVAHASGARIEIDVERLPRVDGADADAALRGGEEYELAITAPATLDVDAFARAHGVPLTEIGRVRAGAPEVVALERGVPRVASPGGWDHFSS